MSGQDQGSHKKNNPDNPECSLNGLHLPDGSPYSSCRPQIQSARLPTGIPRTGPAHRHEQTKKTARSRVFLCTPARVHGESGRYAAGCAGPAQYAPKARDRQPSRRHSGPRPAGYVRTGRTGIQARYRHRQVRPASLPREETVAARAARKEPAVSIMPGDGVAGEPGPLLPGHPPEVVPRTAGRERNYPGDQQDHDDQQKREVPAGTGSTRPRPEACSRKDGSGTPPR